MNIIRNIIIFVIISGIYLSNINSLNKRIIYVIFFMYIAINIYEPYTNINTYEDKKKTNSYPIKSYDNVEKKTYDFYAKNYKYIVDNINNTTTDIDLTKYGWPTKFNTQSQDYLDKTRFLRTSIPFPTNADFF